MKSRSIIKQINGKNTLFGNIKKENVFSESLYTSDYNLLINDQESYQYSSYKIKNNKITSHIETKYYDKNQKEVITKNKKFPFNKLKSWRNNIYAILKLKNNIKNEQQKIEIFCTLGPSSINSRFLKFISKKNCIFS